MWAVLVFKYKYYINILTYSDIQNNKKLLLYISSLKVLATRDQGPGVIPSTAAKYSSTSKLANW